MTLSPGARLKMGMGVVKKPGIVRQPQMRRIAAKPSLIQSAVDKSGLPNESRVSRAA